MNNKFRKIIIIYIIVLFVAMFSFMIYRRVNGTKQTVDIKETTDLGGEIVAENSSDADSIIDANKKEEVKESDKEASVNDDGEVVIELTVDHLDMAFDNVGQVLKYYDELYDMGIISDYRYEYGNNYITMIVPLKKEEEFIDYIKQEISDKVSSQYERYSFEISDDVRTLILKVYSDTDPALAFKDMSWIYYQLQSYQHMVEYESFGCHIIIENIERNVVLQEVDFPDGKISISAEEWTGISDHEKAVEIFDAKNGSYVHYQYPEISDNNYFCKSGDFVVPIPVDSNVTKQDKLNMLNSIEDNNILAIRSVITKGIAYTDFEMNLDDSVTVSVDINYWDYTDFPDFQKAMEYDLVKYGKTDTKVTTFLGQDAIEVKFDEDGKYVKMMAFYRNDLIFLVKGTYDDPAKESVVDDFFSSVYNVE